MPLWESNMKIFCRLFPLKTDLAEFGLLPLC
jgi:hypothetical protein